MIDVFAVDQPLHKIRARSFPWHAIGANGGMNEPRIKRVLGFALWATALIAFLPPALLNTNGLPSFHRFVLFSAMVLLLLCGYVLVDSANDALKKQHDKNAPLG